MSKSATGIDMMCFGEISSLPLRMTNYLTVRKSYKETSKSPLIIYHLPIDEENNRPFIAEEWLHWRRGQSRCYQRRREVLERVLQKAGYHQGGLEKYKA